MLSSVTSRGSRALNVALLFKNERLREEILRACSRQVKLTNGTKTSKSVQMLVIPFFHWGLQVYLSTSAFCFLYGFPWDYPVNEEIPNGT